jgi:hypothetical protein
MAEGDEYWTATQEVLQGAEPLVKKPKVCGHGDVACRIFRGRCAEHLTVRSVPERASGWAERWAS